VPRNLYNSRSTCDDGTGFGSSGRWAIFAAIIVIVGAVTACLNHEFAAQPTSDGRVHVTAERELMGTLFSIDVMQRPFPRSKRRRACSATGMRRARSASSTGPPASNPWP